jgi:phosphohistidine phosphatase
VKLYIMRHGPAEDVSHTGRDADRALTPQGRDRVRDVARALVEAGETPHLILSSPLVRALQTAEIVAAVAKLDAVETTGGVAPGGDGEKLVKELVHAKRKRVMLVGHEPDLSALVYRLTGEHVEMLKGMIVGVGVSADADADGTRIRFVLDPKSLSLHRSS